MTYQDAEEFDKLFGGRICSEEELENYYRSKNLLSEEIVNIDDLSDVIGHEYAKNFLNGKLVKYVACAKWEIEMHGLADGACIAYINDKNCCIAQGNSKKEALIDLCQIIEIVNQIEEKEESINNCRKKLARILE